jgi:hypothetical protein
VASGRPGIGSSELVRALGGTRSPNRQGFSMAVDPRLVAGSSLMGRYRLTQGVRRRLLSTVLSARPFLGVTRSHMSGSWKTSGSGPDRWLRPVRLPSCASWSAASSASRRSSSAHQHRRGSVSCLPRARGLLAGHDARLALGRAGYSSTSSRADRDCPSAGLSRTIRVTGWCGYRPSHR